jgi:hypothetical protein
MWRYADLDVLQALPEKVNRAIPNDDEMSTVKTLDEIPARLVSAVDSLITHLDRSTKLRIENIPRPRIVYDRQVCWHLLVLQ